MNGKRISWIDGLKGLGCMIVLWNHLYLILLGNSQVAMEQVHVGFTTFFKIFNVLVNGNFGVCLFVVVSGYIASQKQVDSVRCLVKQILLRYLRFVLALSFVALLIFVLDSTVGSQTKSWGTIYGNEWIALFFNKDYTAFDYFKLIFLLQEEMNIPIWTLTPILLGNILIYTVNFLTRKLPEAVRVFIAIAFVSAGMVLGYPGHGKVPQIVLYAGVCFVGVLLPHVWKLIGKWKEWIVLVLLACALIGVSGGYRYVVSYASMVVHVPDVFYSVIYWNLALAIVLVCLMGQSKVMKKWLSGSVLLEINKLSFPVYLIHFPFLCSLGMWFHRLVEERTGYTVAFVLTWVMLHIVVFAGAWLYNKTWGKWSEKLLGMWKKAN